jgi:hypothetical protein
VRRVEEGLARYREKARARKAARQEARAAARANGKAKLAPAQTAALTALAEVVEAEQGARMPPPEPARAASDVAVMQAAPVIPPQTRPATSEPKPFGRRKRKPRKPGAPE